MFTVVDDRVQRLARAIWEAQVSVRAFSTLGPEEQERWREIARRVILAMDGPSAAGFHCPNCGCIFTVG